MKINVAIPNVTIEVVKGMGNLKGWTPSQALGDLAKDNRLTSEAIDQLAYFGMMGCSNLLFDLDEDAMEVITNMSIYYNLTISNTIAAMIIQVVIDKLAQDKKDTH